MNIVRNRAKCKNCNTIIESVHRHHFVTCNCFENVPNNPGIFVDGGMEYNRCGGNMDNFIDLSGYVETGKDIVAELRKNDEREIGFDGESG